MVRFVKRYLDSAKKHFDKAVELTRRTRVPAECVAWWRRSRARKPTR